jgi:hypothetical protein
LNRGGPTTASNLTPRPGIDTDNYPDTGLSVWDTLRVRAKESYRKLQRLDRTALSITPDLRVRADVAPETLAGELGAFLEF